MLPRGRPGRQWVITDRVVYLSTMDTIRFRLEGRRSLADADVLAELTGRIERTGPDARRNWGRMTPHQMLVHLAATHEAVLGRASFDTPARSSNRIIKAFVLHLPVRWVRNLNSGADPAGVALDPTAFAVDRCRAAETLAELAGAEPRSFSTPHPILGPLSQSEWHRWAFLHTDHHLRQFGQ